MTISTPATAIDGTANLIITGSGMSGTPQLEATNGVKTLTIDLDVNSQSATSIDVNLDTGLAATILAPSVANAGVPLSDSQWSLKWVVGVDELAVVVSPAANHQQREVDNTEKFGGVLADVNFGEQDQLVSPIVTAGNTIKETMSNGKATGYFDGIEPTMTETITHYLFTAADGKWRSRGEAVTPYV